MNWIEQKIIKLEKIINYIYSVGINGYINYEGYQGGTCQI